MQGLLARKAESAEQLGLHTLPTSAGPDRCTRVVSESRDTHRNSIDRTCLKVWAAAHLSVRCPLDLSQLELACYQPQVAWKMDWR